MRLLFDENLSPRFVTQLSRLFPGSVHAHDVGLASANDSVVWAFARARVQHHLEGLGLSIAQSRHGRTSEGHLAARGQLQHVAND